jgi:hypothetical protein
MLLHLGAVDQLLLVSLGLDLSENKSKIQRVEDWRCDASIEQGTTIPIFLLKTVLKLYA